MVLAAMDSAKTLDTNGIIDALTNTSIDTVIGKLAVRKEDHQGIVGTYLRGSCETSATSLRSRGRLEGAEGLALRFHQGRFGADGLQGIVNPLARAALGRAARQERGR